MDTTILSEIGLSDREVAVYLALLRLGTTTTGPLAKTSNVSNAKIYEILNRLMEKGFATYIYKGKVKFFQSTQPSTLLNFYDEKRNALEEMVSQLQKIQIQKEPRNQATVYEGVRAIKALFYEMFEKLDSKKEFYVLPLGEKLGTLEVIQFWSQVYQRRVAMGIKIKTLPNIQLKELYERVYRPMGLVEIRYTKQKYPLGVFIFPNHIVNLLWEETPVAFLITSKENSQRWERFFHEQWEKGKP